MRWSYRAFKVWGISVELHLTFILLFALLFLAGLQAFLFFALVFTVVLAHELIHSFVAVVHGVSVPRITLLPIGGLASIELPEDPVLEIKVSIAGPMFNFMVAGVCLILLAYLDSGFIGFDRVAEVFFSGSYGMDSAVSVLSVLVSMNMLLGGFNMLPAFPMDGGRVFRGVLALWMDYPKATWVATLTGRLIFTLFAVAGILTFNFWWVLLGVFLTWAGGSELNYVNLRRLMGGASLADVAATDYAYVLGSLTWGEFLSNVYRRGRRIYAVVSSDGALRRVLDIGEAEAVKSDVRMEDVAGVEYAVLDANTAAADSLKVVLAERLVLVSDGGRLLGYVTPEVLAEAARIIALKAKATQL